MWLLRSRVNLTLFEGVGSMRSALLTFGALVTGISIPAQVVATETVTYTYDAKGRLVKVVRSGTINNGVTTEYTHDKADNRKKVTTTGASN